MAKHKSSDELNRESRRRSLLSKLRARGLGQDDLDAAQRERTPTSALPDRTTEIVEPHSALLEYHQASEALAAAVEEAKPKDEPERRKPGRPKSEPARRPMPYHPLSTYEIGHRARPEQPEPERPIVTVEQSEREILEREKLSDWRHKQERSAEAEGRAIPGTTIEAEALERLDELREEDEAGLMHGHPDVNGPAYRRGVSEDIVQRRRAALRQFHLFGGRRRGTGMLSVGYQPSPAKAGR